MECKDCKGTGEYKGLVVVEDCRTCQGMGEVKEDGTHLDEANLPEWMRDYKDQIGIEPDPEPQQQTDDSIPDLQIGDTIYIRALSGNWYPGIVDNITLDPNAVRVRTGNNVGYIAYYNLNYNVTRQRWEYIP